MENKLQIPFYIRYDEGMEIHSLSGIGESLIGLEELLPKLIDISGLKSTEVEVKINEASGGCITFSLCISLSVATEIFQHIKDFYDTLALLGIDIATLQAQYAEINKLVDDNPIAYDFVKYVLGLIGLDVVLSKFIKRLVSVIPYEKEKVSTKIEGQDIPPRIAEKAHNLVNKSSFKKTLRPFFSGEIKSIEFASDRKFSDVSKIDSTNFGHYLGENQKILPDWNNGDKMRIAGKFVGWQRQKGTTFTFQVRNIPKKHRNLVCHPIEGGHELDSLIRKYLTEENLVLDVEISRVTLYEKPRLIIYNVDLERPTLF